MKKFFLIPLILFVLGVSPAFASGAHGDKDKDKKEHEHGNKDKDKDQETPKAHLKLDICHNNHIIPVSVHAAGSVETGHGLYDPVTHVFTARVDAPGHDGDTLVRAYLKAGNEEIVLYTNPNNSCTGVKSPDEANKVYLHVCINAEVMLFEGTNLEELKARVDAFVQAHLKDQNVRIGTDCIPVTTTTTLPAAPGNVVPVTPDTQPEGASDSEAPAPLTQLPRTGSGTRTLAVVGIVAGLLGLALLLGSTLWGRWNN